MSVMTVRGGIPYVLRDAAVSAAGRKVRLPFLIHSLIIRNVGAVAAKLYFTEADFNADTNYVTIPVASATYPYGEWAGPVETANGDHEDLWLKGDAGVASIELVAFQRRG
jgi:hypothetical protein